MGNSKYLDNLNKGEREALINKLWTQQNHKCFICGKDIDLDLQPVDIDHIKPLVNNGKDDPSNFGLTHDHCNRSKKDADLVIARKLYELDDIIAEANAKKETPSLKHVLLHYNGSKYDFRSKIEGDELVYSFSDMGDVEIKRAKIFVDQLSKEKTSFIEVPIEYLYHDEIINPRGINSSISLLMKEFHKPNPQLHLSLARIDDNKIKIFDGQHKAVTQILLGVRKIVVRLFIDSDVERLTETNTIAGSKLKQIAFDKSIVRQLHNTLYAETISRYRKDHYLNEDDLSFSEQKIVDHFKGQRANVKLYVVNAQKDAITRSQDNLLYPYINFEGRGTSLPLSYSTFEKTFLSTFVNAKTILSTPLNWRDDEGMNPRYLEQTQLIKLCNIIAEELLINRYDSERGTYRIEADITNGNGSSITDDHLVSYRLFKEEIMYNWIKLLRKVVINYFANTGENYDENNLFMTKLGDQVWINIRNFVINLRELPLWKDRGLSATIFGGKNNYDFWEKVFTTGQTPDGTQVLSGPINLVNMIKSI